MEFNQSATPVHLRFELEGYVPVTREMPMLGDGELKVVLQPIPKKRASATKKTKAGAHPAP
jgi:hypothetical protein